MMTTSNSTHKSIPQSGDYANEIEKIKSELSVPEQPLVRNGDFMNSQIDNEMEDELQPEYDFAQLEGGVRGKYVDRYRAGNNLVRLDLDVAKSFPTENAVNEALRLLMQIAQRQPANNPISQSD
jgi:hypothetical protein